MNLPYFGICIKRMLFYLEPEPSSRAANQAVSLILYFYNLQKNLMSSILYIHSIDVYDSNTIIAFTL